MFHSGSSAKGPVPPPHLRDQQDLSPRDIAAHLDITTDTLTGHRPAHAVRLHLATVSPLSTRTA